MIDHIPDVETFARSFPKFRYYQWKWNRNRKGES